MARVSEDLCLGEVEVGARSSHNTHLPRFHAQGSRQGCQGGGSGRVLILGGLLSGNAESSTNCPFT